MSDLPEEPLSRILRDRGHSKLADRAAGLELELRDVHKAAQEWRACAANLQAALRAREAHLQRVLEGVTEAIITLDTHRQEPRP